ncbi:MAG: PHP domain-containing protein [Drouetiella hepatica Uher 2000/2452]|uniref:PHP domain-containing protein n=1 Tax=Drouetiella hepatica Uher 2000/2452 TaxID=904376 RepID=A0A951QBY0_9CYAN|nr:PHP domain-containing protein [Drouetiella hepatica Uher 2000/2452]
MLELHCHTTHSDGTLTPAQLVEAAIAAGVSILAITDHDTVSGWDEAFASAEQRPIEIVPGLELSTVWNERSMHILGFYPDRDKLEQPLQERLAGRRRRASLMVEKLAALGYPIELQPMRGNMAPGRPHVAAALVKAGYVQSSQEAFERWLGDDRPAYVEYEKFSAIEGIQLLRECGAVPVWAHPYLFRGGDVEAVLPELVAAGLLGLEVYHPTHTPTQTRALEAFCQQYGLLMTGGSDYHGTKAGEKDDRHTNLNQLHLSDRFLAPIQKAAFDLRLPTSELVTSELVTLELSPPQR